MRDDEHFTDPLPQRSLDIIVFLGAEPPVIFCGTPHMPSVVLGEISVLGLRFHRPGTVVDYEGPLRLNGGESSSAGQGKRHRWGHGSFEIPGEDLACYSGIGAFQGEARDEQLDQHEHHVAHLRRMPSSPVEINGSSLPSVHPPAFVSSANPSFLSHGTRIARPRSSASLAPSSRIRLYLRVHSQGIRQSGNASRWSYRLLLVPAAEPPCP